MVDKMVHVPPVEEDGGHDIDVLEPLEGVEDKK